VMLARTAPVNLSALNVLPVVIAEISQARLQGRYIAGALDPPFG
jgi:ABC-type molybdate transport system ATPase subunit